jgi:hypothetical protein
MLWRHGQFSHTDGEVRKPKKDGVGQDGRGTPVYFPAATSK